MGKRSISTPLPHYLGGSGRVVGLGLDVDPGAREGLLEGLADLVGLLGLAGLGLGGTALGDVTPGGLGGDALGELVVLAHLASLAHLGEGRDLHGVGGGRSQGLDGVGGAHDERSFREVLKPS